MDELKILDFAIIVRNMVDIGKPDWTKKNEEILEEIKAITAPENELFLAMDQVYNTVCSLSKYDMVRFELPEIEVLDSTKLFFLSDEKVISSFMEKDTRKIQVYPGLHRSGTLTCNFHMRAEEELCVSETIERARINLRNLCIKIPSQLIPFIDREKVIEDHSYRIRLIEHENDLYGIMSLKSFTSDILRPIFRKLWSKTVESEINLFRCISSTLIQIYKTNCKEGTIEKLTSADGYANELFSIGTLRKEYRDSAVGINENFSNNLSSDEELGVFTLGLSDLLIFDNTYEQVTEVLKKRKKFKNFYTAVMYNTMHYGVLLEWLYLEKFIIDRYNRLLSKATASEKTSPEKMLSLQKRSMYDLIVYRAGITPYPSREEFLEKARIAHRIPEQQEKLEKKRDLATDYVIQEYTLRTNKAIQLVNIFVAATAVFGLMEVIISISQQKDYAFWGGATAGLFAIMLISLSFSWRFISSTKK